MNFTRLSVAFFIGLFLWFAPQAQAVQIRDRCYVTTATTGTGTITLGSAVSGYQTFGNCGVLNGQTVRYCISDGANYEVGSGTYTSSGTTLTRTPTESSNSDSAISLSGTAFVYLCALTADIPSETTPTDTNIIPGTDYFIAMESGVLKRVLIPTTNVQTMTATGSGDSWDKPTGGQTVCTVELWAGGGSGAKGQANAASGGGGGGGYSTRTFSMSALSSTEQVTVGAGGPAQTTALTDGTAGGNTTFGSSGTLVTAYGGGAGDTNGNPTGGGAGGGGGGAIAVGADGSAGGAAGDFTLAGIGNGGVNTGASGTPGPTQYQAGGGGGAETGATLGPFNGGRAIYAGGGGGAGAEDAAPGPGAGGVSVFGGNGGAGAFDASNATDGTQPGGGGGGAEAGNSGKGGDGKAVITCW